MSKWIVDIHGEIEGDYELISKYEESKPVLDKIRNQILSNLMGVNIALDVLAKEDPLRKRWKEQKTPWKIAWRLSRRQKVRGVIMARKKYKIKLNGLEMTASNSWDIKEIETACTLAAIEQRSEGHLAVYDKFMNMSLEIKRQLSEQMGAIE